MARSDTNSPLRSLCLQSNRMRKFFLLISWLVWKRGIRGRRRCICEDKREWLEKSEVFLKILLSRYPMFHFVPPHHG